jgi:cobalt-precorrin-5B (C1)-methyltransferase
MTMNKGRLGYTTGACAAAAAHAALRRLMGNEEPLKSVEIPFPNGERHSLPVVFVKTMDNGVEAAVRKDAGDDPDITNGSLVLALVEWGEENDVVFAAGDGVGTVTRKGLSVPPGEPAINPVPRKMIRDALRELTDRGVRVTISIPGGCEMARKTYNPRLGIVDGLSILGTTGRVRPFSCRALRCSLVCELDVARAAGVKAPVMVPGHIGERSAQRHLIVTVEQLIEVGNEWGFLLELLPRYSFRQSLLWGHPGKLAKLAARQWDTHSSRSSSAIEVLRRLGGTFHGAGPCEYSTTEGFFAQLDQTERTRVAEELSTAIARAVEEKTGGAVKFSVVLVNMDGEVLGAHGDLSTWQKRNPIS